MIFTGQIVCWLAGVSTGAAVACQPSPPEKCEFGVKIPKYISLVRDADALESVCQYLKFGSKTSPFVNRIALIKWSCFENMNVNDSFQSEVFFEFHPRTRTKYLGRNSYSDFRGGYSQYVFVKPGIESRSLGSVRITVAHTRLRVTWEKAIDKDAWQEITENFECLDAAGFDGGGVILVNWCSAPGSDDLKTMKKAVWELAPFSSGLPCNA